MEEKMRILQMVEEGKITAAQAAELLAAVEEPASPSYEIVENEAVYNKKMFRVQVDSAKNDKVNIQLPVKAIKKLLEVTGKLPIPEDQLQGFDLEGMMTAVVECLDSQVMGDIVNVSTEAGDKVRIYID